MNANGHAGGKTTLLLNQFFAEGKKGKAVVYKTPEGDFLSPKAVENAINGMIKLAKTIIDEAPAKERSKCRCPDGCGAAIGYNEHVELVKDWQEYALKRLAEIKLLP